MRKYKTGWCNVGQHEGTKPRSPSGKPMVTCTDYLECPCSCHAEITEMFKSAGLPRPPAEPNPDLKPEPRTFWMPGDPDPMPNEPLFYPAGTDVPPDMQQPVTVAANVPSEGVPVMASLAVATPRFDSTPTGRKARGQLEYLVLDVCQDYADNVFDWEYCTSKLVAEEIGKRLAAEIPSTGAVNSVWDRWETLGFCVQDKKPNRFVKFTGNSSYKALGELKYLAKRTKKRSQAEARRSLRPSRKR